MLYASRFPRNRITCTLIKGRLPASHESHDYMSQDFQRISFKKAISAKPPSSRSLITRSTPGYLRKRVGVTAVREKRVLEEGSAPFFRFFFPIRGACRRTGRGDFRVTVSASCGPALPNEPSPGAGQGREIDEKVHVSHLLRAAPGQLRPHRPADQPQSVPRCSGQGVHRAKVLEGCDRVASRRQQKAVSALPRFQCLPAPICQH